MSIDFGSNAAIFRAYTVALAICVWLAAFGFDTPQCVFVCALEKYYLALGFSGSKLVNKIRMWLKKSDEICGSSDEIQAMKRSLNCDSKSNGE